jgi:rhodanese-related sulfurtransferase
MSPNSARKAEQLGYTNVKVYHDGLPAWSKSNYSILSAQFLKEAWVDKDIPVVLLDVRSKQEASKGFIKGAVAFPADQATTLVKQLELKQKNTPIIVYDDKQGASAITVAKELIKAGYVNVKILTGGFDAWQSAKFESTTGKLAEKASYVPKPRPGEINLAEFEKYAAQLPANVLIIDVRNTDEGNAGMLKTAKLIPAEEIKDRAAAEIPKDKLIITHCSTGIRAEMAYHSLKELGYTNVKFVNAKMEFEKNGSYKIVKE